MENQAVTEPSDQGEAVLQVTLEVGADFDPLEAFNDFPERLMEFLASVEGITGSQFHLWWTQSLSFGRILPHESFAVVVQVHGDEEGDDEDGPGPGLSAR